MGCCGCDDEPGEDEIEGPNKPDERSCTDFLCCLLLFVYWLGMFGIFGLALSWGNPYSVIYGKDYGGFRCGRPGGGVPNETLPKTYYPRLSKDLASQAHLVGTPWKLNLYGICVAECPEAGSVVHDYGCDMGDLYPTASARICSPEERGNWVVPLDTRSVGNRCWPQKEKLQNQTLVCSMPDCTDPEVRAAGHRCYTESYPEKKFWSFDPDSPEQAALCVTQVRVGLALQYESVGAGPAEEKLASGMQGINQVVITVMESKLSIALFGVAAPIIIGFLFIFLMRWAAGPIVYLGILALLVVLLAATVLVGLRAGVFGEALSTALENTQSNSSIAQAMADMRDSWSSSGYAEYAEYADAATGGYLAPEEANEEVYKIAFLVLLGLDVGYTVFLCLFQRQIKIAVEIVEEGSGVISVQPSSLFYPFVTVFAAVALSAYFLTAGVFIGTLRNEALENATHSFAEEVYNSSSSFGHGYNLTLDEDDVHTLKKVLAAYHLFGFLWTMNFLMAASTTVIAGSVSFWFFYRNNADEYPALPVVSSLYMVVRYHLGTMAFGSLIVAVVQFLRIVLEYVDRQTKDIQESNLLLGLAMRCVKCCMWCLEKCIKFVSGYAYIYTALNGESFCAACKATFMLFLNYPAQVSVNKFVQTLLRIIQCVALPLSCAIACYYNAEYVDGSTNPVLPSVFALVLAYAVARIFSGVYETTVDTIFVCAMRDKEKYDGQHTPEDLARALGMNGEHSSKD